ncbi:glycosyltransferase [Mucilaginibacter sp. X5P1]|uniref:glycosyltransferase n=1 Tax=Mucilaginibacter sp. X5P1 TaxID=2723088 RepID=UPI00160D2118|nr:glycosyltransferase [Mucilaginibacter sp. X5P1]MBB6137225.1 glycosyltransferase involved in cell wall biosynthesis [Mucilaginibacter sp. X5P1]
MRVLHVISSMDPKTGGVCEAVRIFANGLEDLGVTNEVVSVDSIPFNRNDKYTSHVLGPAKNSWFYSKKLLPWLIDNISRFEAIIVHGLWLYHGYAVYQAFKTLKQQGKQKKIPKLFVMPHGMLDPYFQRAKGRRLKAIRNVLYWALIEKKLIHQANEILFTCETELILAREPFWPYKPKLETIVGLGVIAPPAYNTKMADIFNTTIPELSNSPYFLFLSRIHEKKGTDMLIAAYERLIEEYESKKPNQQGVKTLPKLIIAGPGLDSPYGIRMHQMVSSSKTLNKMVFFPGMLTGAAKWGAFYGCEAFVLPSHQENFGIAVVEALTCNKAVLISNQVNIWREIHDGGAAIVGDDTNDGTYSMFYNWSRLSPEDKEKMGDSARHCYEKHFKVNVVVNRFYKILTNQN